MKFRLEASEFKMVDITRKPQVYREAIARGEIILKPETLEKIRSGKVEKGDVLATAQIAGVLAVKKTSELIPLCHPIPITQASISLKVKSDRVVAEAKVKTTASTGVEMEALVGVTVTLLTVWDMVKKYEKDERGQYPETLISNVRVVSKVKRL